LDFSEKMVDGWQQGVAKQIAPADGGRDPDFSEFNGSARGRRC
jgi:hypothetical protein